MLIEMFKRWRLMRQGVKWIDYYVKYYGAQDVRLTVKAGGGLDLALTLPETTVGDLVSRFPEYPDAFSAWPPEQRITQTFNVEWFNPKHAPGADLRGCHDFYRATFNYWEKHHGI